MLDVIPRIYSTIHALLDDYVPPLSPQANGKNNRYDMYYPHKVTLSGKDYPSLYFAGVAAYEKYAALYFFPIYSHPEEFTDIPPSLKKLQKGKSCFHISKPDEMLIQEVKLLLHTGFEFYVSKGLIGHK
ncbi:hypothetical protein [Chitinophaga sp. Cy-1792]|uniref:hypothetical protein n=1 Tax=Chitinophaga sp. Cy-1792 TaxID=2608339 RepID=UPI00141E85CE|nr:hypothetical protein [Chitinophaga sp. Cy-1792]NIG52028.1 hypothetical protein [Chitinophaga sp. Cy-1792]